MKKKIEIFWRSVCGLIVVITDRMLKEIRGIQDTTKTNTTTAQAIVPFHLRAISVWLSVLIVLSASWGFARAKTWRTCFRMVRMILMFTAEIIMHGMRRTTTTSITLYFSFIALSSLPVRVWFQQFRIRATARVRLQIMIMIKTTLRLVINTGYWRGLYTAKARS